MQETRPNGGAAERAVREEEEVAAAQAAIAAHTRSMGLEEGLGARTDVWHLMVSVILLCNLEEVDLEEVMEEVQKHLGEAA